MGRFRSAYDGLNEEMSVETSLSEFEPTMTQQASKDETDINNILRQFKVTGLVPAGIAPPTYGDFSEVVDFRTAMDAVNAAQASFMAMPAETRARFGNDPQLFLEFCSNPQNLDEMRKLGLMDPVPKVEDKVMKVEVVNSADPAPSK